MPFLLLYLGDGQKFDRQAATEAIQNLQGVKQAGPSIDYICECDYSFGDDSTTIRFNKTQETIAIDGTGEASLSAAFQIQSSYPGEIRMIDEGYNFDLALLEIKSLDELRLRVNEALS